MRIATLLLILCALFGTALPTAASIRPVPLSLRSTVAQDLGKTRISIEYSRPNAQGRVIFGGLVPFGEVWRTGANRSTALETSTAISLAGKELPAGRYSFFTIPGEESWTIIINSIPDQFGAFSYDAKADVMRFDVAPTALDRHVETFTIGFENVADNQAQIVLSWEKTSLAIPVSVTEESNHQVILGEIERDLVQGAERDWQNYGEAARYYVAREIDLAQAAEWYGEANKLNPDAFWLFYERAKILAQLERAEEAREAVEAGIESARRQNNKGGEDWGNNLFQELKI